MAVIYAFGDSITYGAWDISGSGWVNRLRQFLDELQEKNPKYYGLFYNLGIPGETTAGLVNRFEHEVDARERQGEEGVFIFAYGANDAAFLPAQESFRVSKEEFQANFSAVLEKAIEITKKIIVVNILPVIESINSVPRNGKIRLNKYMAEYNQVLTTLADKYKLQIIDVHALFLKEKYEDLFVPDDGLHPNDRGHELIFEAVKPVLQKMIGWY